MTKLVPHTYANEKLINPNNDSWERLQFLSNNCVALAQLLEERVPAGAHDQGTWASPSNNSCGTTGCALGWAAMSHLVPGLQYDYLDWGPAGNVAFLRPKVNGKLVDWPDAGKRFFGRRAFNNVFTGVGVQRSRVGTIKALYKEAERLCEDARAAKAEQTKEPA
jgi:hypothetical protein